MKMAQPMPNMTSKSKNLEETELPLQQPQKLEPLSASLQPATTPNAAVMQPYLISLCDILGHIGANLTGFYPKSKNPSGLVLM